MAEILDFDQMNEDCDSAEQALMKVEEMLSEKERATSQNARRSREADDRLAAKYNLPTRLT